MAYDLFTFLDICYTSIENDRKGVATLRRSGELPDLEGAASFKIPSANTLIFERGRKRLAWLSVVNEEKDRQRRAKSGRGT